MKFSASTEGEDLISCFITDSGCGFSEEEKERAFTPFYAQQTQENSHQVSLDGSGLGLYTAQHLSTHAGGDIKIQDSSEKGSTLCFRIPKV